MILLSGYSQGKSFEEEKVDLRRGLYVCIPKGDDAGVIDAGVIAICDSRIFRPHSLIQKNIFLDVNGETDCQLGIWETGQPRYILIFNGILIIQSLCYPAL